MKKVFITGIAGLIGSSLAHSFLKKGWKVAGCDNLIGGYKSNIPPAAKFHQLDILDTRGLILALQGEVPSFQDPYDVVIHCAALAYEGLSVFSPTLITTNIYSGTMSVATAAIQSKVKLLVNCSSMARYGDLKPPFNESDVPQPTDPYGLAKLQAEQQLALLEKIYPDFKHYTVVPHNVSGAQQVYTDPYRNVLSIMIHQALAKRKIFIYGDGEQKRSFSHVDDCVDAIHKLIELKPLDKLFNIGPDNNEISINQLAELVLQHTGSSSPIVHLESRPREVKLAWCSSNKAQQILDYKATRSVEDIIVDIKNYILTQGIGKFNYKLDLEITSSPLPIPMTWANQLFNE